MRKEEQPGEVFMTLASRGQITTKRRVCGNGVQKKKGGNSLSTGEINQQSAKQNTMKSRFSRLELPNWVHTVLGVILNGVCGASPILEKKRKKEAKKKKKKEKKRGGGGGRGGVVKRKTGRGVILKWKTEGRTK